MARLERFIGSRLPDWVPSPIKEVLWVRPLREHLGARVLLFDDVPCLLLLGGAPNFAGAERWVYRGLPPTLDTRPFFFHRMRSAWMRTDGSKERNLRRHRMNLV